MTRRDALAHMAKVFGAASLAPLIGCGPDGRSGASTGPTLGVTPTDLRPEDLRDKIDTVVFMMMENRSFDHYFGALRLEEGRADVDGLRGGEFNRLPSGREVPVHRLPDYCLWDPPHYFDAGRAQLNGGALDGFVRGHYAYNEPFAAQGKIPDLEAVAGEVMGYHGRSDLPFYYSLADEFVLCQRWFSSQLGSTYPNRYYVHGGTASGQKCNDIIGLLGTGGIRDRTIYHVLNELGVDWRYYFTDLPFVGLYNAFFQEALDTFLGATPLSKTQFLRRVGAFEQFCDDAERGELPPVTVIDPGFFLNDDHPPHNVQLGQMTVETVLRCLMNGPQWERSLFVLTYDEWGGFYDHVVPGRAPDQDEGLDPEFGQLGFRVPALVVGPYQKRGFVSNITYDHTSWIAFLEWMWGLNPLTPRTAWAGNLVDTFDVGRVLAGDPRPAPTIPSAILDPERDGDFCRSQALENPSDPGCPDDPGSEELAKAFDAGTLPRAWDRRDQHPRVLRKMNEVLRRYSTR